MTKSLVASDDCLTKLSLTSATLKSPGIPAKSYGAMLVPVLFNKLPPDVRLIISQKVSSSGPHFDSILKAVEVLMARVCMLCHTATSHRHHDKSQTTATTFLTGTFRSSNLTCCYCQHPNLSGNSDKVKSAEAHKQILQSTAGSMIHCLGKVHLCQNCRFPIRCSHCKGRHHTSLCEVKNGLKVWTSLRQIQHQPLTVVYCLSTDLQPIQATTSS